MGNIVNAIDSIVITEENNTSNILAQWSALDPGITTSGQLTSGQAVKLFINWSDKNGTLNLQAGDYFTLLVPDIFRQDRILEVTDAAIKTPSNEIAATYSIHDNGSGIKEITITFTDYVESHSEISGDFWMLLFVGNFETTETKIFEFVINDNLSPSGQITVKPPAGVAVPVDNKSGHSVVGDIYNGYYIFNWIVRINMERDPVNGFRKVENFSFEDVIPDNSPHVFLTGEIRQQLGLLPNQFPLRIGEYGGADEYPAQDRYPLFEYQYGASGNDLWSNYINYVPLADGYTSTGIDGGSGLNVSNLVFNEKVFSADLGTLTRPTSIQYCTIATIKMAESALGDPEVVKLITNSFTVSYGKEFTSALILHRFDSGGSAQGIIGDYSFKFTKSGSEGTGLAGAMFALYSGDKYENGNLSGGADRFAYSDNDGLVTFSSLPAGIYYIQETIAPYDYMLDDTIYKVILSSTGFEIYYGDSFENLLSGNNIINRRADVEPVSVTLTGTKNLTGKSLMSGMFRFSVKDKDGNTVATATNGADGKIVFSGIVFDEPGKYIYTVEEVKGGSTGGITYDTSVFTVTVTITDEGGGTLTSDVVYSDEIIFDNSYTVIKKPCQCPSRTTKCRKTIAGTMIWADNDNQNGTRPDNVEIILLRDGQTYKTATVDARSDWNYVFCCVPIWSKSGHEYDYSVDAAIVTDGYTKTIEGYNITNALSP